MIKEKSDFLLLFFSFWCGGFGLFFFFFFFQCVGDSSLSSNARETGVNGKSQRNQLVLNTGN